MQQRCHFDPRHGLGGSRRDGAAESVNLLMLFRRTRHREVRLPGAFEPRQSEIPTQLSSTVGDSDLTYAALDAVLGQFLLPPEVTGLQ